MALACGHVFLAMCCVFFLFVSVVTVTHDLVHASFGIGRTTTDILLFVVGALLLESGHAYRISHLRHHRTFPGPDDPEGDPARWSFLRALLHGPFFLPRLWCWAWQRSRSNRRERAFLLAEAAFAILFPVVGFWIHDAAMVVYATLVLVGSWIYPAFTVHLPHHGYGSTSLTQTRTLRGRIVPHLFLELTYHLEHHLYPAVPSARLALLARRLDPWLAMNGVRPVRVP